MCQVIYFGDSDITSIGELRELVGAVVLDKRFNALVEWPDDSCLCPIDIEATVKLTRYTVRRRDDSNYVLTESKKRKR